MLLFPETEAWSEDFKTCPKLYCMFLWAFQLRKNWGSLYLNTSLQFSMIFITELTVDSLWALSRSPSHTHKHTHTPPRAQWACGQGLLSREQGAGGSGAHTEQTPAEGSPPLGRLSWSLQFTMLLKPSTDSRCSPLKTLISDGIF